MDSVMASCSTGRRLSQVTFNNIPETPFLDWFANGLRQRLLKDGHLETRPGEVPDLVLNFTNHRRPRPFRRKAQATFVVGVVEVPEEPDNLLRAAYPVLVKSLSNLLIYITNTSAGTETYFITLEQGYYTACAKEGAAYFEEVYQRIEPLASSRLVINNIFDGSLPDSLCQGDEITDALARSGAKLDALNLLPAPFPLQSILGERDLAHVNRLFGIGGLSYGNLSARKSSDTFWMTGRGVNKGDLKEVGRDFLLITGYKPERDAMVVRVPPDVEPRGASVDAIEHWALYRRHPGIGAIIHIHAWMQDIASTTVNYPCGTYELAQEVATHVSSSPDPTRAVIGLKNHGLTITGRSLDDIFERIDGRILPQVPME